MPQEKLPPMRAIGRLSNPFIYTSSIVYYSKLDPSTLDNGLNAMGQKGWKLHTIERINNELFLCVWEKLDYGEEKS